MSLGSDERQFNVSLIVKGKVTLRKKEKKNKVFDTDTRNLGFVRHVIGCVDLFIMCVFCV